MPPKQRTSAYQTPSQDVRARGSTMRDSNHGIKSAPPKMNGPRTPGSASQPIDLTEESPTSSAAKGSGDRKRKAPSQPCDQSPVSHKKRKRDAPDPENKRLRAFRPKPPMKFFEIYERALGQRFYVLSRKRGGDDACPEESIEMTGSTGNVYSIGIGRQPTCNCPHALQGNQCKHVIYVLARVLHAPFDLVYQLALLPGELREIFAGAPPISAPEGTRDKKRKTIEGDCPICFSEFDSQNFESVVYCRAMCGQNVHQECFEMWAKTRPGEVTCPLCRSPWEGDPEMVTRVQKDKGSVSEGYVNVANQLGISGVRDTSTYYRPSMFRRFY